VEELSGRVAIVTGGASNLGAEIVRTFEEAGATVVVADLVETLPDGAPGHLVGTDVTDPDQVDRLMAETVERFGSIDCLVNCAAIWFRRPILDITPEEWDQVLAVNLRGPFLTSRAAAPIMGAQGGGAIVNVGSQAGSGYTRGQGAHYAASKAGVSQLSRVLSFELGPLGIRVNCVAPGLIWSQAEEPPAEVYGRLMDQTPLGRFATPADVAGACRYLASDAAAAVTGQTLLVNGGALAYL
jgi:3-oxoacyl-[acyl-carrier protein] reductase